MNLLKKENGDDKSLRFPAPTEDVEPPDTAAVEPGPASAVVSPSAMVLREASRYLHLAPTQANELECSHSGRNPQPRITHMQMNVYLYLYMPHSRPAHLHPTSFEVQSLLPR